MGAAVLAAAFACAVASSAPGPLVYAYTYEVARTDGADHAHGVDKMDPGGGGTFLFHNVNQHYIAPSFDQPQSRSGTIAVDVVREESDGGLVLNVRETPVPPDGAAPVTCVAFGDTSVVCDPNREVGPEVAALLGALGKDFVDASRLDSRRHWHLDPQGPGATASDYTIVRSAGPLLDIVESARRTPRGSAEATEISARIEYDAAHALPVRLDQTTVMEMHRGSVGVTVSTHTTLELQTPPGDSSGR
ncbi:MAG TPA: hypothetical protein VGF86_02050 [Candidatus Tumulicola sp.]|jgi:hypothetical protein